MAIQYARLFSPVNQFELKNGALNVSGRIFVYLAETDDLAEIFDENGTRLQQPAILDNNGRARGLFVDSSKTYWIDVQDQYGESLFTIRKMTPCGGGGGSSLSGQYDIVSSDGSLVVEKSIDAGVTTFDITVLDDKPTVWVSSDNPSSGEQYLDEDGMFVLAEGSKEGTGLALDNGALTVREGGWYHLSVNWHASKASSIGNEYRPVSLLVNGAAVGESLDMSKTADVQYGAWNGDLELSENDTIVFATSGLASDNKTSATLDKVSVHKLASVIGGGGGSGSGLPDIHVGDDKKILQANYSGGAGSATWEDPAKVIARVLAYSYYGDAPEAGVIRVHASSLPDYGAGSISQKYIRQVLGGSDIYYYDIYPRPSVISPEHTTYMLPIPRNTLEVVASGMIDPECATWLFDDCTMLTTISPIVFDGQVTDCSGMFMMCYALPSDQIFAFDTSNVVNMRSMFYNCRALTTLPDLDYSSVSDVSYMFAGCTNATESCLPLYQQLSANPNITSHEGCFRDYGINTPAIAGDLDLIPQSWGGNAEG